jgi:hypothetical protein
MGAFNVSANAGVIPPPPGVVPDFSIPETNRRIILVTNILLSVISAHFVGLRLYTTGYILRSVGPDDCKCSSICNTRISSILESHANVPYSHDGVCVGRFPPWRVDSDNSFFLT